VLVMPTEPEQVAPIPEDSGPIAEPQPSDQSSSPDAADQSVQPTQFAQPTQSARSARSAARRPDVMLGVGLLWWSIMVTALCFLPLGLAAAAFCLRAARAAEGGDQDRAQRSWRAARRWVVAAIVVGLLVDLLILAVLLLLGAFAP